MIDKKIKLKEPMPSSETDKIVKQILDKAVSKKWLSCDEVEAILSEGITIRIRRNKKPTQNMAHITLEEWHNTSAVDQSKMIAKATPFELETFIWSFVR